MQYQLTSDRRKDKHKTMISRLRALFLVIATGSSLFLTLAFKAESIGEELFGQLGISKTNADEKISNSILGGYLDAYGVKNLKNLASANKAAIAKDLLNYTKQQVNSAAFIKQYNELRQQNKPVENPIQSPEQLQQQTVAAAKKAVADLENTIKTADANLKPTFEKMLVEAKKMLKDAQDTNNRNIAAYRESYPEMMEANKQATEGRLQQWEAAYPENHLQFVKKRLEQFLEETDDIDFSATVSEKNGRKIFDNTAYERKSNRWKMGYRAGKEVVETSRSYVKQWISEIK